jgi:PAS domain S-box-containing protein
MSLESPDPRQAALARAGVTIGEVVDALADAVIVTDAEGGIILWNRAATELYGWNESDVRGRRLVEFLGPSVTPDRGDPPIEGLQPGRPRHEDRRLITKSGRFVDVQASTRALRLDDGRIAALVGVSHDVSALRDAQASNAAVSEALRSALVAENRRALLAEATGELAVSLTVAGSLQRLAHMVVPELADWVIIDLADQHSRPVQVAMLHRDGMEDVVERFTALQPTAMTEQAPIMRVLAHGEPRLVAETSIATAGSYVSNPELLDLCDQLGICSVMYVPLTARGRTLGCITLVSGASGRHYDDRDLDFALGLAQRAALVVDNSSLYEREHRVAQVLQESLLPSLPEVDGLEIAATYRPGDLGAQVGGDFYDVLALADGSVGLAVGDVVGHDLAAAATMGQLRGLLRACAWEDASDGGGSPGEVLDRADRLVHGLGLTRLATVLYARAQRPGPSPGWVLHYATAGHPLPLLRRPDGTVVELGGSGLPLGARPGANRSSHQVTVPVGSVLVAFTDGLVERRPLDWDVAVAALRSVLAEAPADIPLGALIEQLLASVDGQLTDDVAVLVVRFTET